MYHTDSSQVEKYYQEIITSYTQVIDFQGVIKGKDKKNN